MMKKHIVFGVSPFNTKFNKPYIVNMLDWGFANFEYVDIIHPHEEAKYLLMGCGNDEVKAKKKSRKEYVRIKRIVEEYLILNRKKLFFGNIIKFADFYDSDKYISLYNITRSEYELYPDFRKVCVNQTEKAIFSRKKATYNEVSSYNNIAVEYVIREIPFIVNPNDIFSSNYRIYISYYSNWNILDYIYKYSKFLTPSSSIEDFIIKDHSNIGVQI